MSKKSCYTADDIGKLKKANPSLGKTAAEKYAMYQSKDPFPWISQALLNSADLLKYLLTVGIIDSFEVSNLKGVTYQCTFSGEAHRFDPEIGGMKEIRLNGNEELVLGKNSITYLKIKERFRVPEYMVLRFNLSVSNAYKGLLLGTGPIIDPGFNGNLFIPLHNLTGNEYVIKKGAPLIRVEFTKLSRNRIWEKEKVCGLPFVEPITKETPQYTAFSNSIEEALLDPNKKKFYTKGDVVSVRSSIPDAIADSANKAKEAQKSAKKAEKNARIWTVGGAVGAFITIVTVLFSVFSLVSDTNARYDSMVQEIEACKQQICALTQQLDEAMEQLIQYETALPQDHEEGIAAATFDGTGPRPALPSGEESGDDNS